MIGELNISDEELAKLKLTSDRIYAELVKDKENIVKNFKKYRAIELPDYNKGVLQYILAILQYISFISAFTFISGIDNNANIMAFVSLFIGFCQASSTFTPMRQVNMVQKTNHFFAL